MIIKILTTAVFILFFVLSLTTASFAQSEECPPGVPGCPVPPAGNDGIGTINPPDGTVPQASGDPSSLVSGIVRNGLTLFITIAFIIALIWLIIAGLQFMFAGGDPKNISSAWSRIYWGLIGLVVVMSSFAIIKIVEIFFNIQIISGDLYIPRI